MGFVDRTLILGLESKMTARTSAKGMIKPTFSGTGMELKISSAGNVELPMRSHTPMLEYTTINSNPITGSPLCSGAYLMRG